MRKLPLVVSLAIVLALATSAGAEERKRRILGAFGSTLTSEYTAQALVTEKKGVIVQPYGKITLALADSFDVFGGFWFSLDDAHTDAGVVNPPGTPKRNRAFYEADWFAGATVKYGRWALSSAYWELLSPNDGFETAGAVESILALVDRDLLVPGYALEPYLNVYVETHDKTGSGTDEGWYVQPGLRPNHTTAAVGHPLTIALPTSAGFGFDDFFAGDEAWGYFSTGIAVTALLAPYIPAELGAWSLTPSFAYWRVNEDVQYKAAGANRTIWSLTLHVDF